MSFTNGIAFRDPGPTCRFDNIPHPNKKLHHRGGGGGGRDNEDWAGGPSRPCQILDIPSRPPGRRPGVQGESEGDPRWCKILPANRISNMTSFTGSVLDPNMGMAPSNANFHTEFGNESTLPAEKMALLIIGSCGFLKFLKVFWSF